MGCTSSVQTEGETTTPTVENNNNKYQNSNTKFAVDRGGGKEQVGTSALNVKPISSVMSPDGHRLTSLTPKSRRTNLNVKSVASVSKIETPEFDKEWTLQEFIRQRQSVSRLTRSSRASYNTPVPRHPLDDV